MTEHCHCAKPAQPWRHFGITPSQRQKAYRGDETDKSKALFRQCSRASIIPVLLVLKVSSMSCRPSGWDADTLPASIPDHHSRKALLRQSADHPVLNCNEREHKRVRGCSSTACHLRGLNADRFTETLLTCKGQWNWMAFFMSIGYIFTETSRCEGSTL